MPSVGAYLRELRKGQGVSVDELSRATRVLGHNLEALEADDLASLPAPVFTKGFIRAYCQALGVSPDEALALYDQRAAQIPPSVRIQVATPPAPDHSAMAGPGERRESRARGTTLVSLLLLVVLGAALFALTLALRSGHDADDGQHAQVAIPQPGAPAAPPPPEPPPEDNTAAQLPVAARLPKQQSPSGPQPGAPATSATPAPSVVTPIAAAPAPAAPAAPSGGRTVSPYRLVARTTETTWMRVRTEDGRTSEETIPANEIREWISNGPFVITIGNAGGVSLELNGRPIPRLGASGAVVTRLVLPADPQ